MIRVMVMAESSLLAGLIVSNLTQESDMEILRLTTPGPDRISEAIREDCSVLIFVEDGKSKETSIESNDLFGDDRCFRIITLSPRKHHIHICDSYEMPISGMAQVTHLARDFRREKWTEATE